MVTLFYVCEILEKKLPPNFCHTFVCIRAITNTYKRHGNLVLAKISSDELQQKRKNKSLVLYHFLVYGHCLAKSNYAELYVQCFFFDINEPKSHNE